MKSQSTKVFNAGPWIHTLHTAKPARVAKLAGAWTALVWPQNVPNVPSEIQATLVFTPKGKLITGKMNYRGWKKSQGIVENILSGGFSSDDSHLELQYTKKKDHIDGWGMMCMKLSPDASELKGFIVGVSSNTSEHFVSKIFALKGKGRNLKEFSHLVSNKLTIYIGHGRSDAWKVLKDHLHNKHHYKVETFESGARAGRSIKDVLKELVSNASIALLIMSGEDEMKSGELRARQNVVHEIGLFQGKLGDNRAIVLLEDDTERFTNIDGVLYIPFKKNRISDVFGKVVAAIKREFPKA